MKIKIKLIIIGTIAVLMTVLYSCKKNAELSTNETINKIISQSDIKVNNGTLSFKNDSIFIDFWTSILKRDSKALQQLHELKTKSEFSSLADIFKIFNKKMESVTTKSEYLKILEEYKDIVKVNSDSTIALKYDLDSFSEIMNRNGDFIVNNQTKNWVEISKKQARKNSQETLSAGIFPYGLIKKWTLNYSPGFFSKTRFLDIELHHEKYFPGFPLNFVHTVYFKFREYTKNFWGTKTNTTSTYHIKDFTWTYNISPNYFNESPITGTIPIFEESNVENSYCYFITNVSTLDIKDLECYVYEFYSSGVPTMVGSTGSVVGFYY